MLETCLSLNKVHRETDLNIYAVILVIYITNTNIFSIYLVRVKKNSWLLKNSRMVQHLSIMFF